MNEDLKYLLLNGGIGFISSLIRVLHNFHKSKKWDRKNAIIRVTIGFFLSYFAGVRLPEDMMYWNWDLRGPTIFFIGFSGVEILDFVTSKDPGFYIDLLLKRRNGK